MTDEPPMPPGARVVVPAAEQMIAERKRSDCSNRMCSVVLAMPILTGGRGGCRRC